MKRKEEYQRKYKKDWSGISKNSKFKLEIRSKGYSNINKKTASNMPVFHTKTIESILEPVAQQVMKMSIRPRYRYLSTIISSFELNIRLAISNYFLYLFRIKKNRPSVTKNFSHRFWTVFCKYLYDIWHIPEVICAYIHIIHVSTLNKLACQLYKWIIVLSVTFVRL